jgi:protocatechuate 3,4-dioxygenase beta subunit
MKLYPLLLLILLASACAPIAPSPTAASIATSVLPEAATAPAATSVVPTPSTAAALNVDILANLVAPTCENGPTPPNQEGPYYLPNTPERYSLLEDGMVGERLIVAGFVVDKNCLPIFRARLDFWQADANGEYDLDGYTLRGHQFTDNKGRYYLETILPGLYESRPIEHIHVKVQSPDGKILTTQLYFPGQPVDGLTVSLTEQDGYWLAIFNFILDQ